MKNPLNLIVEFDGTQRFLLDTVCLAELLFCISFIGESAKWLICTLFQCMIPRFLHSMHNIRKQVL